MSGIFDQVINYAPPSLLKGTVTYKGTWSADTNTPTLINPPDSTTNGFYYVVSAGGTQFSLVFNIGDWIISNGSAWEKVDNTDAVSSVFGRTGAVVGVSTDYSSVGITATAVGASSPSTGAFTTLSATTPLAVASGGTGVASSTGTTNVVLSGSPTITTPVIAQINDASGNETLKLASIASAVNEVTIENAATGNAVHISATGGDASIGLHLAGKGASGYVNVQDSTDATKRIMFNASGGTTNTRTMLSSTQTVDRTLSLPDATDTLVGVAATQTLTNKTLTSPTITGGALNGTLGATTPSSIVATTIQATSSGQTSTISITDTGASGANLRFVGDGATTPNKYIRAQAGQLQFLNSAYSAAIAALTDAGSFSAAAINSTPIGATTPSTVAATTATASGNVAIGAAGQALRTINLDVTASGTNDSAGMSIAKKGTGFATLSMVTQGRAAGWDINYNFPATGDLSFTTLATSATVATLTSTGLNSTAIGATTPSTIAGTTGTFSGIVSTSSDYRLGGLSYLRTAISTGSGWLGGYNITSSAGVKHDSTGAVAGINFIDDGTVKIYAGTSQTAGTVATSVSTFSSTGLAVTGTLSATGNINAGSTTGWEYGALGRGSFSGANSSITGAGILQVLSTDSQAADLGGSISLGGYYIAQSNAINFAMIAGRKTNSTSNNTEGYLSFGVRPNGGNMTEYARLTTAGFAVTGALSASTRGYFGGATGADIGSIESIFSAASIYGISLKDSSDTSGAGFVIFRKANQGEIGNISRVSTTNAVVYNTTSDARLKENLRDFTDSGRLIDALKPRVFDWKGDTDGNGKNVIGFVAQEEHAADPIFAHIGAVSVGDDNPTTITKQWQRSDAALIPILVAELQSLRKRLAALESK